jgi:hypothetical protein
MNRYALRAAAARDRKPDQAEAIGDRFSTEVIEVPRAAHQEALQ